MKRFAVLSIIALAVVLATSSCSITQVKLWFQATRHESVTSDQAKSIADAINAKKVAGCDSNYSANGPKATTCVPDNVASVHCAGTTGDGPVVEGPLKITGYDSFGLDPGGDGNACVDPVGTIDEFGQVLVDHVHLAGWTFDPNTTDPIHLTITDNGVSSDQVASGSRPDVDVAFGFGGDHGFSVDLAETAGTTHYICVTAKNVGAGTDQSLGCKTITMAELGEDTPTGHDVLGLIEGADRVPGGIHIRGFAFDQTVPGTLPTIGYGPAEAPTSITAVAASQTVVRPDVVSAFPSANLVAGTQYGFDFVQPTTGAGAAFADATQICLYDSTGTSTNVQLMCRPIGS